MTAALLSITLKALLNRRRTLLLALLGALLVLIAAIFRLSGEVIGTDGIEITRRLLGDFGIGVLLPLVAVIVGTSALGSEIDDGTIVYLLAKPVPRWRIVLVKLVVAWLVTSVLIAPAIVIAGLVAGGETQLAIGHGLAALVGALEYTAIFVALSLVTSRALFIGTRPLSVRQHALAVSEAFGGTGAVDTAELGLAFALAAAALVIGGAVALAIRRLQTVELRGET